MTHSHSSDRPQDRARGPRRPSRDPLKQLTDEFPTLLAHAVSTFAPMEGPGLSVFDFNPHTFTPVSETLHEGEDFVVRLELPGVALEDLTVELVDNRVVVSGEKREVREEAQQVKLREIRYGKFKRVYPVPTRTTADSVEADFKDGVLTVRVKQAFKKSEGIKINVNNG